MTEALRTRSAFQRGTEISNQPERSSDAKTIGRSLIIWLMCDKEVVEV